MPKRLIGGELGRRAAPRDPAALDDGVRYYMGWRQLERNLARAAQPAPAV